MNSKHFWIEVELNKCYLIYFYGAYVSIANSINPDLLERLRRLESEEIYNFRQIHGLSLYLVEKVHPKRSQIIFLSAP